MPSEFALIRDYLTGLGASRDDVLVDSGDDCALVQVPAGASLALTMDTLVAGVHFFADVDPYTLGHKALAVNLSDLAAMGAEPAWVTLALTLPNDDQSWLAAFAAGFANLANAHGVRLIGGDTTQGPLSITIQAHGLIPADQHPLCRHGAQPGDLIVVSGTLGDAALALRQLLAQQIPDPWLRQRLEQPTPRIALGQALRPLASAAIDLSDGLVSDLGHLLTASGCGAEINLARLPLSAAVAAEISTSNDWQLPLAGGDDYELCFTVPPEHAGRLESLAAQLGCQLTVIGTVDESKTLRGRDLDGELITLPGGYEHFVASGSQPGARCSTTTLV